MLTQQISPPVHSSTTGSDATALSCPSDSITLSNSSDINTSSHCNNTLTNTTKPLRCDVIPSPPPPLNDAENDLGDGQFSVTSAATSTCTSSVTHTDSLPPHGNNSRSHTCNIAPPSPSPVVQHSPGYDLEAPLTHKTTGAHERVFMSCVSSGLLGKRKSSERQYHLSDDGYCTWGSCESTPRCSTTSSCVCRNKIKRNDSQILKDGLLSCERAPSTSNLPRGSGSDDVFDVREDVEERVGSKRDSDVHIQNTEDNSDENVNGILAEFDSIFESPEAVAALRIEEETSLSAKDFPPRPPPPSPSPPLLISDCPAALRQATPPSAPPPSQPLVCGSGDDKNIEMTIGLEEIAKREDEELKKAMEESLKQQVSMYCTPICMYMYNVGQLDDCGG